MVILKLLLSFRFWQTRWVEGRPVADWALDIWSFIKESVRCWEGLSKYKRSKDSSYGCLVSNYTDALIPSKLHFFSLHCLHIWGLFGCFLKWSSFGLISLLRPRKDFFAQFFSHSFFRRLLVDGLSFSKKKKYVADKVKFLMRNTIIPNFQNLFIKMIASKWSPRCF